VTAVLLVLLAGGCLRSPGKQAFGPGGGGDPGGDDSGDTSTGNALTFAGHSFWPGDPHAHTGRSGDGEAAGSACADCGALDDVFTYARDVGLSWVALTDHVNGYPAMSAADFATELADVTSTDAILTIPAAEVWFTGPTGELGHKTLLLFGDDLSTLTLDDVRPSGGSMEVASCDAIWSWADTLAAKAGPILLVPHHPAGVQPMPTDWTCADEGYQPVVEIYSEQGNALGDTTDFDPPWSGTVARGTVHHALDPDGLALKMGFLAGTDEHDTLPGEVCGPDRVRTDQPYGGGLTMVVLPEGQALTRSAILDAMRARSVYATSGPAVPMDVSWEGDGAVLGGLGEDITVPTGTDLVMRVSVPPEWAGAVVSVEGVGPLGREAATDEGDGSWSLTIASDTAPAWIYPAIRLDGDAIYGNAGCDDGGSGTDEWVWGSPSWLTRP
jgi:hypothetical protein